MGGGEGEPGPEVPPPLRSLHPALLLLHHPQVSPPGLQDHHQLPHWLPHVGPLLDPTPLLPSPNLNPDLRLWLLLHGCGAEVPWRELDQHHLPVQPPVEQGGGDPRGDLQPLLPYPPLPLLHRGREGLAFPLNMFQLQETGAHLLPLTILTLCPDPPLILSLLHRPQPLITSQRHHPPPPHRLHQCQSLLLLLPLLVK